MLLKLGNIVINPTARFLAPILSTFTTQFLQNFNLIRTSLLGFAIGDLSYDKAKKQTHNYFLFIVVSVNGVYDTKKNRFLSSKQSRIVLKQVLGYFKTTSYYYDDYIYDDNIHVIVIKLPQEFNQAYDNFIKGKYSAMYSDAEIKILFSDKNNIAILKKLPEYKETFKEKIKQRFGVSIGNYKSEIPDEIINTDNTEFELPPSKNTDWLSKQIIE